ncbi:MAG TPA: thioesterase [Flavobacteriaceae bacterium]|jgi:acyl-CoA thioester hydrolase|nr:thioesterase [Flavobacteriaceae bacterium]HBS11109.1 thioesterase [Flavobacteriaceae bacterium]
MVEKTPEDKVSFQYSFKVTLQDIDDRNHVNNMVYLQWVQDVSGLHWESLASKELQESVVWFVLRHEIDYINQAYANDTINVVTWIDDAAGVKSTRIVHIYCEDKLLCKCKTSWCLLDAKSLKPKRIDNDVLAIFMK